MGTQHTGAERLLVDEFLVPFRMKDAGPAVRVLYPPATASAIRGLLLEAGNILYDDTAWRRWLLRLLMRLGLRAEYGPFFRIFECDFLDDVHCGRKTFDEAMNAFLISAGLSAGQADEACRALDSYRRRSEDDFRPLIGVPETLAQLRSAGVTLGCSAIANAAAKCSASD